MVETLKIFFPPSPSYNYQNKFVRTWLKRHAKNDQKIIDVGSGSRILVPGIINIDIRKIDKIHVTGNAFFLPIKDNSVDIIVCSALLEHVSDPKNIVNELYRVLKKLGYIYIEVPFLQAEHFYEGDDFRRYTLAGVKKEFTTFDCLDSGVCIGPFSVLVWYIRKFGLIFSKSRKFQLAYEFIVGWLFFWLKYFDIFVKKAPNLKILNGGVYFLGQKK